MEPQVLRKLKLGLPTMNLSQNLNERVRFVSETPADELVRKHLTEVFDLYQELFGEVCTGCPTKIAGYINRIKKLKKSKVMKDDRNFKLKTGSILPVPGSSKVYTNENLTDEIALKFIKKNPNLDELLSGKEKASEATHVVVGENNYTVEEGTSILAQIGVNTSAKTIEGVQKRFDGLKAADRKKLDELLSVANTIKNEGDGGTKEPVGPDSETGKKAEEIKVNNPEMPDEEE
jgi:hypothetical protein